MAKIWKHTQYIAIVLLLICPITINAHSGRLDANGGHYNRTSSEYHCHREPCFSNQKSILAEKLLPDKTEALPATMSLPSYDREDWRHWMDDDNDCQNTRAELLIEQSKTNVAFTDADECTVLAGEWIDPYTTIKFTSASEVDIDHVVPLHWAHEHGGAGWSIAKKEIFANDAENLLIVDKTQNRKKGSQGVNEWMPPNARYHCDYLNKWFLVISKYGLHFKSEEVEALTPIISECKFN